MIIGILNPGFGDEYQKVYEDFDVVPVFCLHMVPLPPPQGGIYNFHYTIKAPNQPGRVKHPWTTENSIFLFFSYQVTIVGINLRS